MTASTSWARHPWCPGRRRDQVAIYAEASLLDAGAVGLAVASAPLMVGATLLGRRINSRIGERGYTLLFWGVMGGYSARLLFA